MNVSNLASLQNEPHDWLAIDVETANRHRRSICSVGIALVRDGKVVASASQLVDPREEFDTYNMSVHRIGPRTVAGAPTFAHVWPSLHPLLNGAVVAAHNAAFDVGCLRQALASAEIESPSFQYLCSCRTAKQTWPTEPSYALGWLASRFEVALEHHDARSDAIACAELVLLACRATGTTGPAALAASFGARLPSVSAAFDVARLPAHSSELGRPDGTVDAGMNHRFYGKTLCFTGSLMSMVRQDAAQHVGAAGGNFVDAMNRKVDYLVVAEEQHAMWLAGEPTGKIKKLLELRGKHMSSAEVLSEGEFLAVLFGG